MEKFEQIEKAWESLTEEEKLRVIQIMREVFETAAVSAEEMIDGLRLLASTTPTLSDMLKGIENATEFEASTD